VAARSEFGTPKKKCDRTDACKCERKASESENAEKMRECRESDDAEEK